MENCPDQKRPSRISSNFDFSAKKIHIVHGWGPFSFARCTIALLLQANDKSAWRVTSGGDSRQRNEFADFGALAPRKTKFSANFMIFQVHQLHGPDLDLATTFCSAYESSWGFAYSKPCIRSEMENCSHQKRLGRISSKFDFSAKIVYIVHGW